jgi:hypothetical protein
MTIDSLEFINFGFAKLPPGYAVIYCDDHKMWIKFDGDGLDWSAEGAIHWNRWASYRGAWRDYREQGEAKP